MKKALIILSHIDAAENIDINSLEYDSIFCADGGLTKAIELGLHPDYCIGDFDSGKEPSPQDDNGLKKIVRLPAEKDMTDSEAALDMAISLGYDDITFIGGLGGRFDHTLGNLGMLSKYTGKLAGIRIIDGYNKVFIIEPGTTTITAEQYTYIGIFSWGESASGITLEGFKYPLNNATLTNKTTLGASNEISEESATITLKEGRLLVIKSIEA